jgi:hypothetical protein
MTEETATNPKRRYVREPNKPTGAAAKVPTQKTSAAPRETKIGKVIALLKGKPGATLEEMVNATGWQPHTTRAALTGLKKKGHIIERDKRGDVTCYRITGSA